MGGVATLAFLVAGAATTIYGPLVPTLRTIFGLGDHQVGLFFTVQSGASVTTGALSGLIARRCGTGATLGAGYLAIALGAGTLLASWPWPGVLAASALIGIGLGLVIPTTNIYFAQRRAARSAALVTVVNLVWGAGAFAWPAIVRWALPDARWATRPLAAAALVVGVTLWLGRARFAQTPDPPRGVRVRETDDPAMAPPPTAGADGRGPHGPILLFALMFFAYGGAENALGGWLGDLVRRADAGAGTGWLLVPSAFYLALAAGRVAMLPLLTRSTEIVLATAGLAIASVAQAGLFLGALPPLGVAIVSGAGLAVVFPVSVTAATRALGAGAGVWMAPIVSMAGVGGALMPWLVGLVSSVSGSLAMGLLVALASTLVTLAVYMWVIRASGLGPRASGLGPRRIKTDAGEAPPPIP